MISPELVGPSVHLRCSFVPPAWNQPLGFQVVWARHIGNNMKAEIQQESTLKPFSLAEMDGVHFRLGETVIPGLRRVRPVNRSPEEVGGGNSVAGLNKLAPHASCWVRSLQILTENSGDFILTQTDAFTS